MIKKVEALLFFTSKPIDIEDLKKSFNINDEEMDDLLIELRSKYSDPSGIILKEINNSILFQTNPAYYEDLINFLNLDKKKNLTKAAMEVLSIVAYKQPVTKTEIDYIRGVKSDSIMSRLVDDEFIYVSGTMDSPGRPNLYETTDTFLRRFNLSSLEDLPELEDDEI